MDDVPAEVVGVTVDHGEAFNVLRYEHGQHYFSHHDFFDPKLYPACPGGFGAVFQPSSSPTGRGTTGRRDDGGRGQVAADES